MPPLAAALSAISTTFLVGAGRRPDVRRAATGTDGFLSFARLFPLVVAVPSPRSTCFRFPPTGTAAAAAGLSGVAATTAVALLVGAPPPPASAGGSGGRATAATARAGVGPVPPAGPPSPPAAAAAAAAAGAAAAAAASSPGKDALRACPRVVYKLCCPCGLSFQAFCRGLLFRFRGIAACWSLEI